MQLINIESKIREFALKVTAGVDSWIQAGAILVELVEAEGKDVFRAITAEIAGLTDDTLELFLSIGRKEIYPMLALDQSAGAENLAGLPYEDQEKYYKDGIPVVERCGDAWEIEVTPVAQLTSWECRQVFDTYRIRNKSEQIAWLEHEERLRQERRAQKPKPNGTRYMPLNKGDTTGFDADSNIIVKSSVSLDELKDATPLQLLRMSLDQAHVSMMDARRHLEKVKKDSLKDDLISHALNAIGKLRFAAANNEL